MKNKFLIILLVLLPIINYGQQLSVNETLDYISKMHTKYDKYQPKDNSIKEVKYDIDDQGFLNINFYLNNIKTATNSIHINDVGRNIKHQNQYSETIITLKCLTQNCLVHKSAKEYYKDDFNIYITQEYQAIKIVKALNYLFSLLEEINFKRDQNDPFATNNNIISSSNSEKSKKIKLLEQNGTYRLSVNFNELNETFILDTGASETTISNTLEEKLISNKLISQGDYLADGLYKIADGSIISQRRVLIKKVSLGSYTVNNLIVSIGNSKSPLLLGKNFLDKFKNWTINNTEKTIELTSF